MELTASRAPLVLSVHTPVGQGLKRVVYTHPDNPDLLIKVIRPGRPRAMNPIRRRRRLRRLQSTGREVHEFLALNASSPGDVHLVERIHGFCDTDLGFGLIVEALRGPDGEIARTLAHLLAQGLLDAEVRADFETFAAAFLASDLVVSDFGAPNLVYAYDAASGRSRFVVVDGIGEKLLLPLNTMSFAFRRWNKRRLLARLRRKTGLVAT